MKHFFISDNLKKQKKNSTISFHRPGYRGFKGMIPEEFFEMDVPSSSHFDPMTYIRMSQSKVSGLYRSPRSFYLTNGATSGIYAMISLCTKPGDTIIVDRHCHRSVIDAIILMGLVPVFLDPVYMHRFGFSGGHSKETLQKVIEENPKAKAVLITSPTYYGVVSDVKELAAISHEAGMYFLVDEACGAHFQFSSHLPAPSIQLGADFSVQSIYKTLGAISGSGILHVNTNDFLSEDIEDKISLFTTSDFSVQSVAITEMAIYNASKKSQKYKALTKEIRRARNCINTNTNAYWLDSEMINTCEICDMDITRAVINFSFESFSGYEAADMLFKNSSIEVEFADELNIICVFTPYTEIKEIRRFVKELLKITSRKTTKEDVSKNITHNVDHDFSMTPQLAFFSDFESVTMENAIGRVSKNIIFKAPQGVAVIIPGEVITALHIKMINDVLSDGGRIEGLKEGKKIDVVKE